MLRVVVDDGEATATFELPDYALQGIASLSYNDLVSFLFDVLPFPLAYPIGSYYLRRVLFFLSLFVRV
jgi:hypothetical protein